MLFFRRREEPTTEEDIDHEEEFYYNEVEVPLQGAATLGSASHQRQAGQVWSLQPHNSHWFAFYNLSPHQTKLASVLVSLK